jgi:hypothetical protein
MARTSPNTVQRAQSPKRGASFVLETLYEIAASHVKMDRQEGDEVNAYIEKN